MVDDQDRCEWLNISSGTGSPGKSWTQICKLVLIVVLDPQFRVYPGKWQPCVYLRFSSACCGKVTSWRQWPRPGGRSACRPSEARWRQSG